MLGRGAVIAQFRLNMDEQVKGNPFVTIPIVISQSDSPVQVGARRMAERRGANNPAPGGQV
jgi:hypothetical protein